MFTTMKPPRSGVCRTAAAILAGLLTSLPLLDERCFPAAWAGMILWIAITSGRPVHEAFRLWLVGGIVVMAAWLHWLPQVAAEHLQVNTTTAAFVSLLAVTWDAFRFAVFGYSVALVKPRGRWGPLAWPILWVAIEWVWPHVFPWRMGQLQIGWLPICQLAEVAGPFGVSFLLIWAAAVAAEHLRTRRGLSWHAAMCGLALATNLVWGTWRMHQVAADAMQGAKLKLLLVQPGALDEQTLPRLRQLSQADQQQDVDLVVWGESTVGCYSLDLASFQSSDPRPCPALGRPLLCAGSSFAPGARTPRACYNPAFLIDGHEDISGRYHKRVLLPWGEYAVGQQWIPELRDLLGRPDALMAGDSAAPLMLSNDARLGMLICYEDLLSGPARDTVEQGANVLVNLNNLSPFGRTAAVRQHQLLARFRAIENRRWLVRCGTTGGTAVISATGEVQSQAAPHVPAILAATVPLIDTRTLYSSLGDVLAGACLIGSLIFLASILFSRLVRPASRC